ncbi:MAG: hypothetical protein J5824_03260 [Lachnospiraceae bacterium]|nr:hypothetical protein [Lachnospiraceae bacterium]
MNPDTIRVILSLLQICMLGFIIIRVSRKAHYGKTSVITVFFIYGIICLLISDMYWLVHGLLRPDVRLPFSVNEVGEMGTDLLFASMLAAVFKDRFLKPGFETICAAIFAVAIAALWVGWTGEWVKDILSGIVFGYYTCVTVRAMRCSEAFTFMEWLILSLSAYILIAVQGLIFAVDDEIGKMLDVFCYIIMFSVMIWLVQKATRAAIAAHRIKDLKTSEKSVALSFFTMVWIMNTMYMSSEPMYFFGFFVFSLILPVMMISVFGMESVKGKEDCT